MTDESNEKLADDLLEGAQAAADYIGKPIRAVYHMVREQQIPHFHVGTKLHFRKSELNRHFSGLRVGASPFAQEKQHACG